MSVRVLSFLFSGVLLVHCLIEYRHVNLEKSWTDAQQYCREHYVDLATLENETDVNRLPIPGSWVWIGLYDDPASWNKAMTSDSNSWRWSSTGTTSPGGYQNWASTEPNNYDGVELCVYVKNGEWFDGICALLFEFFCYNVQPSGLKEYFLITTPKNWSDSQSYCRQHYHDLAMIESSAENQAVTAFLSTPTTNIWIGLYRVAWKWSNGSPSTYRKWRSGEPNNAHSIESCASQNINSFWNDAPCSTPGQFVCYEGKYVNV
ncbi:hypothetical protein WMY93_026967 [Mugilogobius chulae]|uniref:C-type lectin domain-containing protein n=1 Tax=Mugilogobius chulae TaxID=88201 RepID=A0AAW0MYD7_9GOBI